MSSRFLFTDFCKPAKVYLVIAFVTLLYYVSDNQNLAGILLKAILFIVWGFLLNQMCKYDLNAVAWLLAIIPQFVFLFFTVKTSPAITRAPTSGSDTTY
jgi:hypothetical protein